ncbi:type II secretion system protein GspL [Chitiniphilus purpureus]|uniref:Type II secretion system protein GspL n=1 Tax=Chitiniphilus purpureus TaxID=2981137 RepID=A0ABY6DRR4_9NEIS|nr:type II secretion system protein GspL [Chitiniphilus sp. CD1]UXY17059.1 type II secretion system protein GspL [Chitiniphilus sp. CD1]
MSAPLSPARLRVLLGADPADDRPLPWFALNAYGQLQAQGQDAPGALPHAARLELLVPPERISTHQVNLPRQPLAKLRALLPLALEDKLLAPAAQLHFALQPLGERQWRVFVLERAWLAAWLARLQQAGHQIEGAYPLASLPRPAVAGWLQLSLPDGAGLLISPQGETVPFDDPTLVPVLTAGETVDQLALEQVCAGPVEVDTNLLQGDFTAEPAWRFDWRPWRRVAALAGALLLLCTVANLAEWWRLQQRTEALKREMRQTFAAAFPGVPVIDPVLQLASRLREAGVAEGAAGAPAGGDALALLQRLDTLAGPQLRLARIRLAEGRLELEVIGDAAALQRQLAAAGLAFELQPGSQGRGVLWRQE